MDVTDAWVDTSTDAWVDTLTDVWVDTEVEATVSYRINLGLLLGVYNEQRHTS